MATMREVTLYAALRSLEEDWAKSVLNKIKDSSLVREAAQVKRVRNPTSQEPLNQKHACEDNEGREEQ